MVLEDTTDISDEPGASICRIDMTERWRERCVCKECSLCWLENGNGQELIVSLWISSDIQRAWELLKLDGSLCGHSSFQVLTEFWACAHVKCYFLLVYQHVNLSALTSIVSFDKIKFICLGFGFSNSLLWDECIALPCFLVSFAVILLYHCTVFHWCYS